MPRHRTIGRSRSYGIAYGDVPKRATIRALLQNAELVMLDESFAALDPENLKRAVECAVKRAPSLLAIAHR